MPDKTCGTCKWYTAQPDGLPVGACMRWDDDELYCQRLRDYNTCCGGYEERTDSLEQLVHDMLYERAVLVEFLPTGSATLSISRSHGKEYTERARVLGVDV